MADELRIGLAELLCKAQMDHDADFLREGVRILSQALMEMEVEEHVGAARSGAVTLSRSVPATASPERQQERERSRQRR
jgi:transposase-like protein